MKIFWSWQSDTPGKIGRHLVRDALREAVRTLKEAADFDERSERDVKAAIHLDHDRQGVTGSPDLVPLILEKIGRSNVFVADITLVGKVEPAGVNPGKKLVNSNVAIELGYALHSLTDRSVLLVINQHYGSRSELPFDLQLKAGHILYNLAPDAGVTEIAAAAGTLKSKFIEVLRPLIAKEVAKINSERPFQRIEFKQRVTRFRAHGEPLGTRDGVGLIDQGAGIEIHMTADSSVSLRLLPNVDPGRKWTSLQLLSAHNHTIDLPTLLGGSSGQYTVRANDGIGTCVCPPSEKIADSVTFAFKSGEIWAISNYLMSYRIKLLFVSEIESALCAHLPIYSKFLQKLGVLPPYRWIAAVDGVKGRELQYPVADGRIWSPGFQKLICVSDVIVEEGMYDGTQSAVSSLLPFFNRIYEECGVNRPSHLPR